MSTSTVKCSRRCTGHAVHRVAGSGYYSAFTRTSIVADTMQGLRQLARHYQCEEA